MGTSRWLARSLAALTCFTLGSIFFGSPAYAQQAGVLVTPSGYRVPVFGVSMTLDAEGHVGTSCNQLTAPEVDALRFTRSVSRSLLQSHPRSIV